MMDAAAPATRRAPVEPLTARAELFNVLRVAMVIVVGTWIYIAVNRTTSETTTAGRFPYQALMQDRAPREQRMFRDLQEGLVEAEGRRAASGAWPTVATLAADAVPPFAFDPTSRRVRYRWSLMQSGFTVNYLGIPERPDAPAWLLLIREPDPAAPPDAHREDEEHHKLTTGVMLHVSTWVRADGRVPERIVPIPQGEGWTQLLVGAAGTAAPAADGR
jgi:hypothetical protein